MVMKPLSFLFRLPGVVVILLCLRLSAGATDGPSRDSLAVAMKPNQAGWMVQSQLQHALSKHFPSGMASLHAPAKDFMTDLKVHVSKAAADGQNTAAGLFQYLDSQNKYKEGDFTAEDLAVLPVGIKKTLGNQQIEVGFLKAAFYSNYAELTAFVRIKASATDPNSSTGTRTLFFGADKVRFTKAGGVESFRAALLGDFVVPVGGFSIVLKGGANLSTGTIDENNTSFVRVHCGVFEEAKIVAEVAFPRDKIIPLDAGFNDTGGRVTARFQAGINSGFQDILTEVDFSAQPFFAVASFPRLGFRVSRAVLDLSDSQNSAIPFPAGYPVTDATWRGLYIQDLSLILPSEFQKQNGQRITNIGVQNLIFDSEGVTGSFSASSVGGPLLGINEGSASGWGMSLNQFSIQFERNSIRGGSFSGAIKIPVSQEPINYAASIQANGNYDVMLNVPGSIRFNAWRANATLDLDHSYLRMTVANGRFRPMASLSGSLDILTNASGADKDASSASVKFTGIRFENLVLKPESPYVDLGPNGSIDFAYTPSTESKMGDFGVSLRKIGVIVAGNRPALDVEVGVSLMNGGISGIAGFNIGMVMENGSFRVNSNDFQMKELIIDAKVGDAFRLQGAARYTETDQLKEFRGRVDLTIAALGGQSICAAGVFGHDKAKGLHYWYVEAKAPIPGGIPIAPPLVINSISGAAYHNMAPVAAGGSGSSMSYTCGGTNTGFTSRVKYVPDERISLGFKAAVGFGFAEGSGVSDVLDGTAGLEMTFAASGGLSQISLFGEAALTRSLSIGDKADFLNQKLLNIVNNQNAVGLKDVWNIADVQVKMERQYGASSSTAGMNVRARLGMLYDFQTRTFHGEGELYMNVMNGFMKGTGPNDRVGKAVFHFDPNKWYIHIGKSMPYSERVALEMNVSFIKSRTSAYLMIGHDIPTTLPCPGTYVSQVFPELNCQGGGVPRTDLASLNSGKGFAFGASVQFGAKMGVGRRIAFAEANAELGFDLLIQKVGTSSYGGCTVDGNFGFNKWYGEGQVYGYAGIRAGLLGITLARGEAAAKLNMGGPEPLWFKGQIRVNIQLFQFIRFSIDPNLSVGRVCSTI
jgi:hypothetical protein